MDNKSSAKQVLKENYLQTLEYLKLLQEQLTNEEQNAILQLCQTFFQTVLEYKEELMENEVEYISICLSSLKQFQTIPIQRLKNVQINACQQNLQKFYDSLNKINSVVEQAKKTQNTEENQEIFQSTQYETNSIARISQVFTDDFQQIGQEENEEKEMFDDEQFQWEAKLVQVKETIDDECKQIVSQLQKIKQDLPLQQKQSELEDQQICQRSLQLNKLESSWNILEKKLQNGDKQDFILVFGSQDSQSDLVTLFLAGMTVQPIEEQIFCSSLSKQNKIIVGFPSFKNKDKVDEEELLSQRCLMQIKKLSKSITPVLTLSSQQIFDDKTCELYIEFLYSKLCGIFQDFDQSFDKLTILFTKKVNNSENKEIIQQLEKIQKQIKQKDKLKKFIGDLIFKTKIDLARLFETEKITQESIITKIEFINQNQDWRNTLPDQLFPQQQNKIQEFIQIQGKSSAQTQNFALVSNHFNDQSKLYDIFKIQSILDQQKQQKENARKQLKDYIQKIQDSVNQSLSQKQQQTQKLSKHLLMEIVKSQELLSSWEQQFKDSELKVSIFVSSIEKKIQNNILTNLQDNQNLFENKIEQIMRLQQINQVTNNQYQKLFLEGLNYLEQHLNTYQSEVKQSVEQLFQLKIEPEEEYSKDQVTQILSDSVGEIARQFYDLFRKQEYARQWNQSIQVFKDVKNLLEQKCEDLIDKSQDELRNTIKNKKNQNSFLSKKQFILLKSIRQYKNRLGCNDGQIIQFYKSLKLIFQSAWQQIYDLIIRVIKEIQENDDDLKNKKILNIEQLEKFWNLKFFIIELFQMKDLDQQIKLNTYKHFSLIKNRSQNIVKIIGQTSYEELQKSISYNQGQPNQIFLENMTALVQLNSWFDKTLNLQIVSEEYNKVNKLLNQNLTQLQNKASRELESNYKSSTDMIIEKVDQQFSKYYEFFDSLDQNQQNGEIYQLTVDLVESHKKFIDQFVKKLKNFQGIVIKDDENINTQIIITSKIFKMYSCFACEKDQRYPLLEAYKYKQDQTENKVYEYLKNSEKLIQEDKQLKTAKEKFKNYQMMYKEFKNSSNKIQNLDGVEKNLKLYIKQLEERENNQIYNELATFLEKKQIGQLNIFIDKLSAELRPQCSEILKTLVSDQQQKAVGFLEAQEFIKSWEAFLFLEELKQIQNQSSQILCSQLSDILYKSFKEKIDAVLQKYEKFSLNKIKGDELDSQYFFEILHIMSHQKFSNEIQLKQLLDQIQQQLYIKLNQFLTQFQINKSKLSNMDNVLSQLDQIRPFLNTLNEFKGESLSKNLYDLKSLLPQFFQDLNLVFELVEQIGEQAKRQFQEQKFDQLSLTMEMSRNCDKCAQYFKMRNISHQKLVEYFIKQLQIDYSEINKLLEQKQFNSDLAKLLDNLDNIIQCFKEEHQVQNDLNYKKKSIQQTVHNLLSIYQNDFIFAVQTYKNTPKEQFIEQMGDNLLKGLAMSDKIQQFSNDVQKFVTNCMEFFFDNLEIDEILLLSESLTNEKLGNEKQTIGQELIDKNANFSFIANLNFQNEVLATHNVQYVLDSLKQLEADQNSAQPISKEEFTTLQTYYDIQDTNKNLILQKFLLKKNRVQLLAEEIQKTKNQLKENVQDLDKTLSNLLQIIAQIFTLWQFIGIDDKFKINKIETAQKGMKFPHAAQIISVFLILGLHQEDGLTALLSEYEFSIKQNIAIECLTGQGKSLILAVSAALFVIVKDIFVDVGCYSQYLTQRDEEDFKYFFQLLEVSDSIKYGTLLELAGNMLNQDIDIRNICSSLIIDDKISQIQKPWLKRCFLLDEYDTIGQEQFYGQTYDATQIIKIEEFIEIQKFIWKNQNLSHLNLKIEVEKLEEYKNLLIRKSDWTDLLVKHIHLMIQCVKQMDTYLKDTHYFVQDKKIGYKMHDMTIKFNTNDGYFTVFAHFREKEQGEIHQQQLENIMGMHLVCGHFSYADLLKKYCFIKGVTGTLQAQHKCMRELMKQYFPKNYLIPSMFSTEQRQRLFDQEKNINIFDDKQNYYLKILTLSEDFKKNQQAIQIYFNSNIEIQEYLSFIKDRGLPTEKFLILDAQTKKKDQTVKESTRAGQITLIIRDYGRGTDYKVFDPIVKVKGGVVVIQTFFSSEKTEEIQIQGRTCRQNNKGEYFLVLLVIQLSKVLEIHEQDIREMSKSPSTAYGKLDAIRSSKVHQEILNLIKAREIAQSRHDQTLKFKLYLQENKLKDAKEVLNKIGIDDLERNLSEQIKAFHFLFVIDISGSMKTIDYKESGNTKTRYQIVQEALKVFIQSRLSQTQGLVADKISIITYDSKAEIKYQYEDLSENIQIQAEPLYETFFHFSIQKVIEVIKKGKQQGFQMKTIVMFLTDGQDMSDKQLLYNELQIVNNYKEDIQSWSNMGFGPNSEMGVLKVMTHQLVGCNAEVSEIKDANNLNKYFQDHAIVKIIKKVNN